jgi:hypothetical protein
MKFYQRAFILLSMMIIGMSSCKKEKVDPVIPNEEELITSLIYTLVDTLNNDTVVFSIVDPDGDGGLAPVITTDTLQPNTVYYGYLQLYNDAVNPPINIGDEIVDEGTAHQFFYEIQAGLNMQVTYDDADANGNPIGMDTWVQTGAMSYGELVIILRHEPDKYAMGVSEGDIENAGGDTDIEVNFDVTIN